MSNLITTQPDSPVLSLRPPADVRESPHTPLRRLVDTLFRNKALLFLTTAAGGLVGATIAILQPNLYTSQATFLFQAGSEQVSVFPGMPSGPGRGVGVSQNAPYLLQSPELAQRAVERVGIEKLFQPFRPTASDDSNAVRRWIVGLQRKIHDVDANRLTKPQAVQAFLSRLSVLPYREASMLEIKYEANDPRLAQEVLADYVKEAMAFHMEIYSSKDAIAVVEESSREAVSALRKAKDAMKAFLEQAGIDNFEIEFEHVQNELTTTKAQERDLRTKIPIYEYAIERATEALKDMDAFIDTREPVPVVNNRIASLGKEIEDLKTKLAIARTQFTDDQPEVKAKVSTLATLERELEAEREKDVETVIQPRKVANEEFLLTKKQLRDDEAQLVGAKLALDRVTRSLVDLEKRYSFFLARKPDHDDILGAINYATTERDHAAFDLKRAREKEALNTSNLSSLALVAPPRYNPVKSGPERPKMVLLGLVAGLGIGIVILTFRSLTDTTIRTPEEIEKLIGLRVLATVPRMDSKNIRRHRKRLLSGC